MLSVVTLLMKVSERIGGIIRSGIQCRHTGCNAGDTGVIHAYMTLVVFRFAPISLEIIKTPASCDKLPRNGLDDDCFISKC